MSDRKISLWQDRLYYTDIAVYRERFFFCFSPFRWSLYWNKPYVYTDDGVTDPKWSPYPFGTVRYAFKFGPFRLTFFIRP